MQRREFIQRALLLAGAGNGWFPSASAAEAAGTVYAPVLPGVALQFPRDYGAHPEHRIEWWYVTGWLDRIEQSGAPSCGFQVTFFRLRTPLPAGDSRFTATQLLFAHVAVSDPRVGHILHEERAARAGFGLAESSLTDTDVLIRDWRLRREPSGAYQTTIQAKAFTLRLNLQTRQPVMLQGREGFSQKGPAADNASYYYSEPHLTVNGEVTVRGKREKVRGTAWLDHEWSSALMPPGAAGWDWLGLNLDDGGALMAFQLRAANGSTPPVWSAAKLRSTEGAVLQPARNALGFTPTRFWTSPNGGRYPVETRLMVGERALHLRPLFDAQELHAQTMGNTYWEGAITAYDDEGAIANRVGRGYWELTGYGKPLRM
jgi:predicted secreted hydrolase